METQTNSLSFDDIKEEIYKWMGLTNDHQYKTIGGIKMKLNCLDIVFKNEDDNIVANPWRLLFNTPFNFVDTFNKSKTFFRLITLKNWGIKLPNDTLEECLQAIEDNKEEIYKFLYPSGQKPRMQLNRPTRPIIQRDPVIDINVPITRNITQTITEDRIVEYTVVPQEVFDTISDYDDPDWHQNEDCIDEIKYMITDNIEKRLREGLQSTEYCDDYVETDNEDNEIDYSNDDTDWNEVMQQIERLR